MVLVVVALLVLTLMSNLASTLHRMHLPQGTPGSVAEIAHPAASDQLASRIIASWWTWGDFMEREPGPPISAPPGVVVSFWLLLDTLIFAPSIALLLIAFARRRSYWPGSRVERWLGSVPILGLSYLTLDVCENILTAGEIFHGWPHVLVRVLSGLKLAAFGAAAIPILLSVIENVGRQGPPGVQALWPRVNHLRVPLVGAGLLALILLALPQSVRPQLMDVLRSWVFDDDPVAMAWGVGSVIALSVVIIGAGLLAIYREPRDPRTGAVRMVWLRAAVLGVIAYVASLLGVFGPTLIVVAIASGVSTVLYAGFSYTRGNTARPLEGDCRRMLAWLAALPYLALLISYLRATNLAGSWQERAQAGGLLVLLVVMAASTHLLVARAPLFGTSPSLIADDQRARILRASWLILALPMASALGLAIWLGADPWRAGWEVGAIGTLTTGTIVVTALLAIADQIFWRAPTGLFRALRMRRVPILTCALGLVLLPGLFDAEMRSHAARGLEIARGEPLTLDDLAMALVEQIDPDSRTVPLFVVAAAGGGARAAYWTLLTTNCLFAGKAPPGQSMAECRGAVEWNELRVASGISGGSVGLAMFASERTPDQSGIDVDRLFEHGGFLDPTVAALMFRDGPNMFARYDEVAWISQDRAAVLEQSWERTLPHLASGFFQTQLRPQSPFPLLMLNSASAADGCRINVSIANLAAASRTGGAALASCRQLNTADIDSGSRAVLANSRDLGDFVCQDLPLSTAALLSARFPFVSPTGYLQYGCDEDSPRIYAVDGGYIDSSGASPLVELLPALIERTEETLREDVCVQPVVLQIDNGYADVTPVAPVDRPQELIAPRSAQKESVSARADSARHALMLAARERCASDLGTYFHVLPVSRPGVEAPLGWSLSDRARSDLDQQLTLPANRREICELNRWFGGPVCDDIRPDLRHEALTRLTLVRGDSTMWLIVLGAGVALGARALTRRRDQA